MILCHFNSILVISEQWVGDNERLCAMEPLLPLKRSSTLVGLETGTARSEVTELLGLVRHLIIRSTVHKEYISKHVG